MFEINFRNVITISKRILSIWNVREAVVMNIVVVVELKCHVKVPLDYPISIDKNSTVHRCIYIFCKSFSHSSQNSLQKAEKKFFLISCMWVCFLFLFICLNKMLRFAVERILEKKKLFQQYFCHTQLCAS